VSSVRYTFDVPRLSAPAATLLTGLSGGTWLRNMGLTGDVRPHRRSGVQVRYVADPAHAARSLASPEWERAISDSGNAVLVALRQLYGSAWYNAHLRDHLLGYDSVVGPVSAAANAAAAGIPWLGAGRPQLAVGPLRALAVTADLEPYFRLEFHSAVASAYLAGHLPCGWDGEDMHDGTLLVH
jgi:hypothetical protein